VPDAMSEIARTGGTHFEPRLAELFCRIEPRILEIKKLWDEFPVTDHSV
jgi:hypothetical protein